MNSSRKTLCGVILILTFIAAPLKLSAQQQTVTIRGEVKDQSGAAVAGARIEVRGEGGLSREVETDRRGDFRIPFLLPGRYTVIADHPGFRTAELTNHSFSLAHSPRIHLELQVETLQELIDVRENAAGLDLSTAAKSHSLSDDRFQELPRGRDVLSLTTLIPGVSHEPKARGVSVYGATAAENRYVLDGVDVSDPVMGATGTDDLDITNFYHVTSGKSFLSDMVEEVQVTTGGYEAELGGATGGIINVITKTGTNDLQGVLGITSSRSAWSGEQRPVLRVNSAGGSIREFTPAKDDVDDIAPQFSLGGALIRDQLWYFVAYQPELISTTRTVGFVNGARDSFDQDFRRDNATGNLAGSSGKNLLYKLAVSSNDYLTSNDLPDQSGLGSSDHSLYEGIEDRLRSSSYSGYADFLIRADLVGSARGGRYESRYRLSGNPDEDIVYFYGSPEVFPEVPSDLVRPDGFASIPTNYAVERDDFTRDNLAIDSEHHIRFFGDHWLKGGLQLEQLEHSIRKGLQKPQWHIIWDQPDFLFGERGTYGSYIINTDFVAGEVDSENTALFIQDRWVGSDGRLMVSLGLRAEEETIPSYADPTLGGPGQAIRFDYSDKMAPRFGFAWDPTGDGRWKARGTYGRFFDRFELSLPLEVTGARRSVYYSFRLNTFDWPSLTCEGLNSLPTDVPVCTGSEFIGLLDERPAVGVRGRDLIAHDLEPTESEEWMLGIDHDSSHFGRFGVTWIHRELVRTVETVGIVTTNQQGNLARQLFIANPGVGIARQPVPGGAVLPEPVRDYDGFEVLYQTPPHRRWWASASYLYSRLWGNYGGVVNTDDIFHYGPNRSGYADSLYSAYGSNGEAVYGRLPTDRPHQVKLQATVQGPWETSIGLFQSAASGTPQSEVWLYQNTQFFPRGRGNLGRTETLTQTDLLLRKVWSIRDRYQVQLDLNVLNVFDEDAVMAVYPRYSFRNVNLSEEEFMSGFDPDEQAAKLPKDALFGSPTFYQPPREVWASLRLHF